MEEVEADADFGGTALHDQGDRRIEARTEFRRFLELKRESNSEPLSDLGRLGQGPRRAAVVVE